MGKYLSSTMKKTSKIRWFLLWTEVWPITVNVPKNRNENHMWLILAKNKPIVKDYQVATRLFPQSVAPFLVAKVP